MTHKMESKSNEKAVSYALRGSSSSKIPVPFKSPKNKKTKRLLTNNLVCSTPVNTVKLHLFADENNQMSPIHNPSSGTTLDNNSPIKALNVEEFENKLQINKIRDKTESGKLTQTTKNSHESEYIFPLIRTVPVLKMMICDSEEETLPRKSKRGRKPKVTNSSASGTESNQNNDKISNVIETEAVIETRELIKTRSKTDITLSDNKKISTDENSKNNKTEQENVNSRTKNNSTRILKSKKLKTLTSKTKRKVMSHKNQNAETKDDASLLTVRIEKIKKDIINDKTKNALNLKNIENKNNIENNRDDIFRTLNLINIENKNSVENEDDIFNTKIENVKGNVITASKSSSKTNSKSRKKTNEISVKIETKNISNKKTTTIKESNHIEMSQTKRRGRPPKTKNSSKNSNVDENSIETRRSERKRIPSSKYWISSYQLSNEDLNGQMEEEFKKPCLPSKRSIKLSAQNIIIQNEEKVNIKEHPIIHSEPGKVNKLESSISKRSLRLVEAAVSKQSSKISDNFNSKEISSEIPIAVQEPHISEKSLVTSFPSVDLKPETNKLYESTKDNMPRQSIQSSKRQSFKKPKSNESKLLTSGKYRKSLALEKKICTPKKLIKKTTNLQSSDKNTSYTTEEEDGIPRDTLLNNADIEAAQMPSQHGTKRKVENHFELFEPKKVRIQTDSNEYNFKKMAVLADISPAKAGGLADVQINGNRCLLGCFGKFPRHCATNSDNADVSVGISLNNTYITTGILEIEPAGKKKYEYAKKNDLLFVVLEGTAQVGIGNSSQILTLGQDFYVPKDTPYYILNISSTSKLLLYFSKFCR